MSSEITQVPDVRRYGEWCLIAGASEGIGAAFAEALAGAGYKLVMVARRPEPLEAAAARLRGKHGVEVRTISADLAEPDAAERVFAQCADVEVGLLIYNAGAVPGMADLHDFPEDEAYRTMTLNVVGQTKFSYLFGGKMRERGRGGIILIGSIASASGCARLTTYSAAKAYSQIFAEGLWYEMKPYGIDVLGLSCTTTRTPAMQQLGMPMDNPEFPSVEPEQVVAEGFAAFGNEPIHFMNGSRATVDAVQAMPRAEAVQMISEGIRAIVPTKVPA